MTLWLSRSSESAFLITGAISLCAEYYKLELYYEYSFLVLSTIDYAYKLWVWISSTLSFSWDSGFSGIYSSSDDIEMTVGSILGFEGEGLISPSEELSSDH